MANILIEKIKAFAAPAFTWFPTLRPGGNILAQSSIDAQGNFRPVRDQQSVKISEPYGTKIPKHILERASGWSQLQNISHDFTIEKVQAAFRQAERGDMTQLFAYYRDFFMGNGMCASELSKRKLSTISEPFKIIPINKKNKDDVKAAEVIEELLDNCPTFNESLVHLMNAIVFPVAALEKTFEAIDDNNYGENPNKLRYKLKQLYPVDYNLITYRLPYLPQGPINIGNQPALPVAPLSQNLTGRPEDTIFDPDSWEPNLRFWSVFQNGLINYSYAYMMAPDPDRHIIYRCNLLHGIARENFGGLGKAVLWWVIMSQMGADVFLRCLQKYGLPLIIAKVDTSQVDTVSAIMEAFGNLNIVNAMAVNKDAIIELEEMNYSGAADAHEKFLKFCHDQISLLISGQVLGSHDSTGGLGKGNDSLQGQIRKDIVNYDQECLNNVLKHGLFKQLLAINGIKGAVPNIIWGGDAVQDAKDLSETILNLNKAGYELTDDSIEMLSEKFGFTFQKLGASSTNENEAEDNTEEVNKLPDAEEDTKVDVAKENVLNEKLGEETDMDDTKTDKVLET